nr:hypothetical protein [Planctomycetota bacterium]
RVLLSLLAREDFAAKEFRAWLPRAWPRPAAKVDPTELARSHNRRHLLLSLLGLLQIERRALPHADAVRTSLTDLLRVWQG